MNTIRVDLFDNKHLNSETVVLYYSGHCDIYGNLEIFDPDTVNEIKFDEIKNLWVERKN